MLHYAGDLTAFDLGQKAKEYLWMYAKPGKEFAYVPFMDVEKGKKRFVKFQTLNDQWVFVDLVNKEG